MALLRFVAFTWVGRGIVGLIVTAVVGATVVAPRFTAASPQAALRTATVARGNVTQTVTVSGSINASALVKAAFRPSGRLAEILVKVGDPVTAGQPLARLEPTDLQTSVKQAEANVLSAQAKYDATLLGATAEDLALAKNSLDSAMMNYEQGKKNASTDVTNAQQALDKVKTSYAHAKENITSLTTAITRDVGTYGQSIRGLGTRVLGLRGSLEARLTPGDVTTARNSLVAAEVALTNADSLATGTLGPALTEYMNATGMVLAAVSIFDRWVEDGRDTTPANAMFQSAQTSLQTASSRLTAALDAVAAQISSAQSSVNTAQSALTSPNAGADAGLDQQRIDVAGILSAITAEQQLATSIKGRLTQATAALSPLGEPIAGSYASAMQAVKTAQDKAESTLASSEITLSNAQVQYSKSTATPKSTDIALALSSLQLAQIALDKARTDLDNATLRAPVAGVISTLTNQVGEAPANPFAVIAVTSVLTLHGTIGESDVAKIKTGQVATLAVDAVGSGTRLTGKVTGLDPVATLQQGVPVYGIDITIDRPDPAVRPGMTGTAAVILQSKQGVLTVPNAAIRTTAGRRTIQVLQDGVAVDGGEVVFGISNDTVTEVVSGLDEGQTVVLPAPRTTTTTGQPGQNVQQIRVGGGAAPAGVPFR